MGLFLILAVLLAVIFEKTSGVWSRALQRIEMLREAQVALETLTQDIGQAATYFPTGTWLYARRASPSEVAVSPMPLGAVSADWLALLTHASEDSSPGSGATRAVVCRIAYADPLENGGTKPFYGLYRNLISPRAALQDLKQGKVISDYLAGPGATCGMSSLMAKNVMALKFGFEVVKDDGSIELHACLGNEAISASEFGVFRDNQRIGRRISAIQVSLTLIPKSTAAKLEGVSSESDRRRLIEKTGISFNKVVQIQTY